MSTAELMQFLVKLMCEEVRHPVSAIVFRAPAWGLREDLTVRRAA